MPAPLVSVLLVSFNSGDDLDACLSALQRQNVSGGYEVVIVDNASSDESARLVEQWIRKSKAQVSARFIQNERNVGYAAANNQAFEASTGRVVVLLNPDAVLDEGCLQALVDHLHAGVGVGVAAAVLRNPDGTPQSFARREISLGAVFWDLTEVGRRIDKRWRQDRGRAWRRYAAEMPQVGTEVLAVDCPAAACVALWRELAGARLFNEQLPLFFNDAELFGRIRGRMYRCEVVPSATAVHGYGTSHRQLNRDRKRAEFVVALRRYVRMRFPLRFSVAVNALLLLDVIATGALSVRPKNRRLRQQVRGTLGGLGLPGGAVPWLSTHPSRRQRVRLWRRRWRESWLATRRTQEQRRRRRRLERTIRREARLLSAPVAVSIDRTAYIGDNILVELKKNRSARLRLGPGAQLHTGVLLRLWGGDLDVGAGAHLRHSAVLTVKGKLTIGPRAIISRNVQVHADGNMQLGFGCAIAEGASVLDNGHQFDDAPTVIFDKPTHQADVVIEPFAFIGANAVVTPGVTVGRSAVVAALSVVTRDVPAAKLAAGAPAKVIRDVERIGVDVEEVRTRHAS